MAETTDAAILKDRLNNSSFCSTHVLLWWFLVPLPRECSSKNFTHKQTQTIGAKWDKAAECEHRHTAAIIILFIAQTNTE